MKGSSLFFCCVYLFIELAAQSRLSFVPTTYAEAKLLHQVVFNDSSKLQGGYFIPAINGKSLRTTIIVMQGVGAGLCTVGLLMMGGNFAGSVDGNAGARFDTGKYLAIVGGSLMLISIPLKARAKKLIMKNQ